MWGAFSSHKRLFNPLPRFSRLGTQCPALMSCHVYLYLCVLYGYFGICGIYLPGMNFMLLSTNGVYVLGVYVNYIVIRVQVNERERAVKAVNKGHFVSVS